MKKVLIVKEGQWGSMTPEEYQSQINYFQQTLEKAEFPSLYQEGRKEKAAEVRVIETAQYAEKTLKTEGADVVLFISRGMEVTAERLATLYPRTRVIVFTDPIPERKVIWIDKKTWLNRELIENVVLR